MTELEKGVALQKTNQSPNLVANFFAFWMLMMLCSQRDWKSCTLRDWNTHMTSLEVTFKGNLLYASPDIHPISGYRLMPQHDTLTGATGWQMISCLLIDSERSLLFNLLGTFLGRFSMLLVAIYRIWINQRIWSFFISTFRLEVVFIRYPKSYYIIGMLMKSCLFIARYHASMTSHKINRVTLMSYRVKAFEEQVTTFISVDKPNRYFRTLLGLNSWFGVVGEMERCSIRPWKSKIKKK